MLQVIHLDAILGSNEEQVSRTHVTAIMRQRQADKVVRQEQVQGLWLCQKAGNCGE